MKETNKKAFKVPSFSNRRFGNPVRNGSPCLRHEDDVRRKVAFTLAEGATHVGMFDNKRKVGFTLAEVLITLGIIGVVSVLTIPNIISNYQKKVYVTQLQKGYSQLQQAFALAMADDEVEDIRDTALMNSYKLGYVDNSEFVNNLKKYMKISKFCNPTATPLEDPCFGITYTNLKGQTDDLTKAWRTKIYTPNGFTYYFSADLWDTASDSFDFLSDLGGGYSRSFEIDVNGDKKPNRLGRDLFSMVLLYDGSLIFPGSQMWADSGMTSSSGDSYETYHWSDESSRYHCLTNSDKWMAGDYCGGRIFDNGWVMDY